MADSSSDSDDFYLLENNATKWFLQQKTEKRFPVHPINKSRQEFGEYHHLFKELCNYPDRFFSYLRMQRETFDYILRMIEPRLQKRWLNCHNQPILPEEQLVVTLRYLCTGASFLHLSFEFRMGDNTVGKIVKETVVVIWEVLQPIHMPPPKAGDFKKIAKEFYEIWNFPNCIGAIDGKHIRVRCPKHSGTMYFNYKHFYSIVLQGVADARYRFIIIEVGGYGKQSDGGTFRSSAMFELLSTGRLNIPPSDFLPDTNVEMPYVFIGDEAYPLLDNLLKPFGGDHLDFDSEYFNSRLSRARKTIECAFGILYSKWRLISKAIETNEKVADHIIKAVCLLQNVIIDKEGFERHLTEVVPIPNELNRGYNMNMGRLRHTAKFIRDTFKTFICRNRITYIDK